MPALGLRPRRRVSGTRRTTTTVYSPATGIPTKTAVTTPPADAKDGATAQTTTTELDPLRGQPSLTLDTNGKRTGPGDDASWAVVAGVDGVPERVDGGNDPMLVVVVVFGGVAEAVCDGGYSPDGVAVELSRELAVFSDAADDAAVSVVDVGLGLAGPVDPGGDGDTMGSPPIRCQP